MVLTAHLQTRKVHRPFEPLGITLNQMASIRTRLSEQSLLHRKVSPSMIADDRRCDLAVSVAGISFSAVAGSPAVEYAGDGSGPICGDADGSVW